MKQEEKKNKGEIAKTIVFIIFVFAIAVLFLHFFGATNSESTTAKYDAESICFISGHYDGVSAFEKKDGAYYFICRENGTRVEFDGRMGAIYFVGSKK